MVISVCYAIQNVSLKGMDPLLLYCIFDHTYSKMLFSHNIYKEGGGGGGVGGSGIYSGRPHFLFTSLRKHAYSNILNILQPEKKRIQIKNSDIFSYFCSKHRLLVLVRTTSVSRAEAVLMSTHTLCF